MADPDKKDSKESKQLSDFTKRVLELTRPKTSTPSVHADKPSEWQRPDKPSLEPERDRTREVVQYPFKYGRDLGKVYAGWLPKPNPETRETIARAAHGYAKWANPKGAATDAQNEEYIRRGRPGATPDPVNAGELDNMVGQAIKNASTRGPVKDVQAVQGPAYDHRTVPGERRAAINTYTRPDKAPAKSPAVQGTPEYNQATETPDQRTQRFKERYDQRKATPWAGDIAGLSPERAGASKKPPGGDLDIAMVRYARGEGDRPVRNRDPWRELEAELPRKAAIVPHNRPEKVAPYGELDLTYEDIRDEGGPAAQMNEMGHMYVNGVLAAKHKVLDLADRAGNWLIPDAMKRGVRRQ